MANRQNRLKEVYEHLRRYYGIHTQTDFAAVLRKSRNSITLALNGNESYLTDSLFQKICAAFPGVFNLEYLLNGEGQLLMGGTLPDDEPHKSFVAGAPYYNVDFTLGFDIVVNDQSRNPDFLIDFPPYNDCYWCNAHGNSMHPTISSGDITLIADNKDVADQDIPKSVITHVYHVKGTFKMF